MIKKTCSEIGNLVRNVGQKINDSGHTRTCIKGLTIFPLVLQLSGLNTAYASVLVRTPNTSEPKLQVYLQKHKEGNKSFVEHWRATTPPQEKVTELQSLFESAQRVFLSEGPEPARAFYTVVADQELTADWKPSERELIFSSILQLANFEKEKTKRISHILRALSLDDEMKIDQDVFPPELVKEIQIEKVNFRQTRKRLWIKMNGEFEVFVNGKRWPTPQNIFMTKGKKRLTIVSNFAKPMTEIVDVEDQSSLHLRPSPFVMGKCGKLKWNNSDKLGYLAITDDNCVENPDGQRLSLYSAPELKAVQANRIHLPEEPKSESILKKPLFWVITAAVVTGAVILLQKKESSNNSPAPTPTHESGL